MFLNKYLIISIINGYYKRSTSATRLVSVSTIADKIIRSLRVTDKIVLRMVKPHFYKNRQNGL